MFHVGQKVVCVDATWNDHGWQHILLRHVAKPVLGGVYTIRGLVPTWAKHYSAVLLEEITNPELPWSEGTMELAFIVERFRPLVKRKTDIGTGMLTALLDPANHRKLTDA